jgi:hypothetical protein
MRVPTPDEFGALVDAHARTRSEAQRHVRLYLRTFLGYMLNNGYAPTPVFVQKQVGGKPDSGLYWVRTRAGSAATYHSYEQHGSGYQLERKYWEDGEDHSQVSGMWVTNDVADPELHFGVPLHMPLVDAGGEQREHVGYVIEAGAGGLPFEPHVVRIEQLAIDAANRYATGNFPGGIRVPEPPLQEFSSYRTA